MRTMTRCLLAAALAAATLVFPALAAQAEEPQQYPSPWAYSAIADSYAMGLMDDDYATYIQSPITLEQLEAMTDVLSAKLAALELPVRAAEAEAEPLVVDVTRGGVMNALYQECAAYALPGVEEGADAFLSGLGVAQGDGAGLAQARPCTYQEAMVMTQRLILAVYDSQDAGSKGLLWKATNGENTLYLLGTIHLDRSNVYPLHRSVREALLSAGTVAFELDFNDAEGQAEFAAMQLYSDGTTLLNAVWAMTGLETYYGQDPTMFTGWTAYNRRHFEGHILSGSMTEHEKNSPWLSLSPGVGEGVLCGGYTMNFALLLGTDYFPVDLAQPHILFLEDHEMFGDEAHVSSMLACIEQSPFMKTVTGLIFGNFADHPCPHLYARLKLLGQRHHIPVVYCDDFGHGENHAILPIGRPARLDGEALSLCYF